MKKIKTKKLVFKKTNVLELNEKELRSIVGGGDTVLNYDTVSPRSLYTTTICKAIPNL